MVREKEGMKKIRIRNEIKWKEEQQILLLLKAKPDNPTTDLMKIDIRKKWNINEK